LASTGKPFDPQDLINTLRDDPTWRRMPSPISNCTLKRNRFTLYVNLMLTLSIVLNILLLNSELVRTSFGSLDLGVQGLIQIPVTIITLVLVFLMAVLAILVFSNYLRFLVCHSISIQLVIRQVGIDTQEFPESYRGILVGPLIGAASNRWLFIMSIITSALTPLVIRSYPWQGSTEIPDLLVIVNFGLSFLFGGLITEWSFRRSGRRHEQMSDSELRNHAESFLERDKEKARRWLTNQLSRRVGRTLTEDELEPLLQLWYNEYLFRDADMLVNLDQISRLPLQEDRKALTSWLLVFGLFSTIVWILNSLAIVLFPVPVQALLMMLYEPAQQLLL
jgi:hypothetical protein